MPTGRNWQYSSKGIAGSTRLAKRGHEIWWEFHKDGDRGYAGRLLIDVQLYPVGKAKKHSM
jgi:hypothetical protein